MSDSAINIQSNFSAKEPSLGYLYQIKYALYLFLKKEHDTDDPILRIENLDDIDIEDNYKAQLFQTKLHIKSKANLTNSSTDFWKTIRIWSEYIKDGTIDINEASFNLVTTQQVPNDSILFNFTEVVETSKITNIVSQLEKVCATSESQTNKVAYNAFLNLSQDEKEQLISKIKIFDCAVDLDEIDKLLKKQFSRFLYPNLVDDFKEKIEGWWLKKAIEVLKQETSGIRLSELNNRISSIRDEYNADCLPNDFNEPLEIGEEEIEQEKEKTFIKQLELVSIKTNDVRVKLAISDFRRAFEQRSEWIRKNLTDPEEEEVYDKKLYDYWFNLFELMKSELGEKDADELTKSGADFYMQNFAKTCPKIPFRREFKEDFLTRGSYHILSDKLKLGWHPKFKENLDE